MHNKAYQRVRARTEDLARVLTPEDQVVQSMPDASPTKWHLAHVTWFFETFVLKPHRPGYREFDPSFGFLFNSYYEAEGARHSRSHRGMITRPDVYEVLAYRNHVDESMKHLLADDVDDDVRDLIILGLHHEQQHQELLLMDIKHLFSLNPNFPIYTENDDAPDRIAPTDADGWTRCDGGIVTIGHTGDGFGFDNEFPRHDVLLRPFEIANRLVTCGEWLAFIDDGGYDDASHWLSDGWHTVTDRGWRGPGYWYEDDRRWSVFGLDGLRALDPSEPVSHLSYYEADAFATWAGARLPTEAEWEHAIASGEPDIAQALGALWQWTSSSYSPYPGFRAAPGAVGEYNGKFMVNTWVLRGGCAATPPGHIRTSYRNFFNPSTRWHFSGVRLARDC